MRPWIAFYSQTGSEIVELSKRLGRRPDLIITNDRPDHLRKIDKRLPIHFATPNKPVVEDYEFFLKQFENPIITLHGWLRVIPPEICEKYTIFNGHPGLITKYPELKGKDPQIRAFEGIQQGKYPTAGCVLHRVTAGVDEGPILAEEKFNTYGLSLDELFHILKDRSLYLWVNFLKNSLW